MLVLKWCITVLEKVKIKIMKITNNYPCNKTIKQLTSVPLSGNPPRKISPDFKEVKGRRMKEKKKKGVVSSLLKNHVAR